MKKLLIIILIGFLHVGCFAQKKRLQEGTITIKGNSFVIKKSSLDGSLNMYRNFITVRSNKNKYINGAPHPKSPDPMPVLKEDMNISESKIKSIINQVLKNKETELKVTKEFISVRFIFEQNGRISDIYYSLDGNTRISADEIEQIDSRLRSEIRANFKGPDYLNFPVIHYNFFMRF